MCCTHGQTHDITTPWVPVGAKKGPMSKATQEVKLCLFKVGNHYKLKSIFKGPYLRPEMKFFQSLKYYLLCHLEEQCRKKAISSFKI